MGNLVFAVVQFLYLKSSECWKKSSITKTSIITWLGATYFWESDEWLSRFIFQIYHFPREHYKRVEKMTKSFNEYPLAFRSFTAGHCAVDRCCWIKV